MRLERGFRLIDAAAQLQGAALESAQGNVQTAKVKEWRFSEPEFFQPLPGAKTFPSAAKASVAGSSLERAQAALFLSPAGVRLARSSWRQGARELEAPHIVTVSIAEA